MEGGGDFVQFCRPSDQNFLNFTTLQMSTMPGTVNQDSAVISLILYWALVFPSPPCHPHTNTNQK